MTSHYKILFTIELLHDYYLDNKCNDIEIIPSKETADILRNGNMISRMVGNIFLVGIKVSDDIAITPFKNIPNNLKLVFYLSIVRNEFMNISAFEYDKLKDNRFYFSNLSNNVSDSVKNLSAPLLPYSNSTEYWPGNLVIGAGNNTFECIKATTGHNTGDGVFWDSKGTTRYVSDTDFIKLISPVQNFKVATPSNIFAINVFELNKTSGHFDVPVVIDKLIFLDKSLTSNEVQLNLSALKEGRYRVNINGEDFNVYQDKRIISSNFLGVIELFTHLSNGTNYAFLDGTGKVQEQAYTIRFNSRRAYWRYYTPKLSVDNIKVSGSNPAVHPFTAFSSDPGNHPSRKDFFVSNNPLKLNQLTTENNFQLELSDPANTDLPEAPKPDPSKLGILEQDKSTHDYFFNMHINL